MPHPNAPAGVTDRRPRLAWRILRLALLFYVGLLLLLKLLENRLVYFPSPWISTNEEALPSYMTEVQLATDDGPLLHGWHLAHPSPRAHILFFHGNAGNLSGRRAMLQELYHFCAVDIFAFDYRGYGKSSGRPRESNIIADARLARRTYATLAGCPESSIVLMGRSLGGAVATRLAAEDGARALVLQSTFTSLPDVAARQYPWLPVRWLMKNRYDSLDRIHQFHGPLLSSHSEGDTILPFSMGQNLFDVANEPKTFFRFSGRDHNDPQPPEYRAALITFLDSLP